MEFEIRLLMDEEETLKVKVKYGTTIRSVLIIHGLNYLNPYNQYGRPIPDDTPLRGPAVFKLLEPPVSVT